MAYNEKLACRVRDMLAGRIQVEEKNMMGGLVFMVNGKMCIGIVKDDLMLRINPEIYEEALSRHGCRPMDFTGKALKGYVFVEPSALEKVKEMEYWISLALEFNTKAKATKKKKK